MLVSLLLLSAQVGDPRRTYAAGDKDAVLMLPPETVCGAQAKEMVWTADGSALVVRREVTAASPADYAAMGTGKPTDPAMAARFQPKTELLVWSFRSHRAQVVASGSLVVSDMRPMPGTDRVVFGIDEPVVDSDGGKRTVSSIALLSSVSGTITRLLVFDAAKSYVGIELSPTRPIGLLSEINAETKARRVRFFGPEGRLGTAITLPLKAHMVFDQGGLPILSLGYDKQGKTITFHYQKVNVASGTLGERYDAGIDGEFDPSPDRSAPMAVSVNGAADGSRAPSILLKLSGAKPGESGIVTTDGVEGLVSPKGGAVAYVAQGSVMVRPLARVSRADYEAAMLAARKAIALNNAKQVATALAMFAADMDDALPSQADYDKLDPYLKDSSLRSSFTYTYAGGSLTGIDKPAETEIGYVTGPGGRAVAYADGHVKWVPDAP